MPLFFWALDTALVNAPIIYRDIAGNSKVVHKDFHLDVAWDFIDGITGSTTRSHKDK